MPFYICSHDPLPRRTRAPPALPSLSPRRFRLLPSQLFFSVPPLPPDAELVRLYTPVSACDDMGTSEHPLPSLLLLFLCAPLLISFPHVMCAFMFAPPRCACVCDMPPHPPAHPPPPCRCIVKRALLLMCVCVPPLFPSSCASFLRRASASALARRESTRFPCAFSVSLPHWISHYSSPCMCPTSSLARHRPPPRFTMKNKAKRRGEGEGCACPPLVCVRACVCARALLRAHGPLFPSSCCFSLARLCASAS